MRLRDGFDNIHLLFPVKIGTADIEAMYMARQYRENEPEAVYHEVRPEATEHEYGQWWEEYIDYSQGNAVAEVSHCCS